MTLFKKHFEKEEDKKEEPQKEPDEKPEFTTNDFIAQQQDDFAEQIEALASDYDELQKEKIDLQDKFKRLEDSYVRVVERHGKELLETQKKLEEANKQLDDLKKKLEDLTAQFESLDRFGSEEMWDAIAERNLWRRLCGIADITFQGVLQNWKKMPAPSREAIEKFLKEAKDLIYSKFWCKQCERNVPVSEVTGYGESIEILHNCGTPVFARKEEKQPKEQVSNDTIVTLLEMEVSNFKDYLKALGVCDNCIEGAHYRCGKPDCCDSCICKDEKKEDGASGVTGQPAEETLLSDSGSLPGTGVGEAPRKPLDSGDGGSNPPSHLEDDKEEEDAPDG
jgi:hypothetical protein